MEEPLSGNEDINLEDNLGLMPSDVKLDITKDDNGTPGSSRFSRRTVMSFCAKVIAFITPILSNSIYLVLPYYVMSTPEYGWGASDLALFYSAISVGEIAGAQVVPLAAVLDSNNALYIGHAIQMIVPFVGFFCMSSMFFFDYWLFTMGLFGIGFSNALSAVQAYCTEIADGDQDFEVELMSQLGQLNILCQLVNAFVLTAIYDTCGFAVYNAALSLFLIFL